jgi:biopolymer transport protein ExbD
MPTRHPLSRLSSGFSKGVENDGLMADINTTPLVDVMLVLLIIFIVTAPLISQGLNLNLPKAEAPVVKPAVDPVVLEIDAQGDVFFKAKPVSEQELDQLLAGFKEADDQTVIQIRADKKTTYEAIVRVMSKATKNGLTKLALITDPPAPAGRP